MTKFGSKSGNLHITHYNVKYASRIFKITDSLIKNKIFDFAYIVGKSDGSTVCNEQIDNSRFIERINLSTQILPNLIFFQLIKYIEFTIKILIKYKKNNIRVVNCHSIIVLPIGSLFKLLYRTKLIYDTHELETETSSLYGLRKNLAKIVEKVLIRFVDQIIVVSNSIADCYVRSYNIKKPVVVLNCPKLKSLTPTNYFKEKYNLPNSGRLFIYQGNMAKGRGIPLLLDAFSILSNPTKNNIVFLGYGPFQNLILKYSKKYENIFYHDAISSDFLLNATSSADIGFSLIEGICLSYQYCLPNKLFEYIMAGLPVVVSDLPELKKVVTADKIGYVLSEMNPVKLKELIENIDSYHIEIMKKNTYRAAIKYNWEKQEKKLLSAYKTIQ